MWLSKTEVVHLMMVDGGVCKRREWQRAEKVLPFIGIESQVMLANNSSFQTDSEVRRTEVSQLV